MSKSALPKSQKAPLLHLEPWFQRSPQGPPVEKKAESPAPPGWQVVWWRRSPNPLDSFVLEGTCQGLWELWTWELLYGFILPHRIQKKIIHQKQQALLVDMTKSVLGSWGLELPLDSWWLSPGLQSPGVMTPDHLPGISPAPGSWALLPTRPSSFPH